MGCSRTMACLEAAPCGNGNRNGNRSGPALRAAAAATLALWALAPQAAEPPPPATPPPTPTQPAAQLDTIVVTGSSAALTRLRSPSAVSTLDAEAIGRAAPDNAAEILRNLPGMVVQSSGGEGNANLSARGLPVSGGAKLMLFFEDGLPVLGFGDIDFGTADTFLRADYSLDRVEVVRGGAAATFASNAPGGVINFISKTGEVEGGSIGITRGLNFDRTRVDADRGGPLGGGWRFHIGGFYRQGEGPRTVGEQAEQGGQIKGNVTRDFDGGYLRMSFKWLRDHAPAYLPVPVSITGTTAAPVVGSLPGFDVLNGALHSRHFRTDLSVNRDGKVVRSDLSDGYDSNSRAWGLEGALRLADGWQLANKFRASATDGRFVAPYPAQIDTAAALATAIGGAGASLRYATGPLAGQTITDPAALNGNGLAVRTHLFNTTLNDLGLVANDLRVSKTFSAGSGSNSSVTTLTLGYFKSRQKIDEDWHWNTYLQEVRGDGAALLDVVNAQGQVVTQGGLVAYGEPFWGNCCVRSYRLRYDTDAPYLVLNLERGPLNLDASLRQDIARASGSYAGTSSSTAATARDVDGDGVLQTPELSVPIVDERIAQPVRYTLRYLSYSLGANLLLGRDLALFARASQGGRANAERVLFGGGIRPDGSIAKQVAVNTVRQLEGGFKWRSNQAGGIANLSATLFRASTAITDQDVTSTSERFTSRRFEANGLELEAAWARGAFGVQGGLTYTRGKIVQDDIAPANIGQQVNPRWLWQLTPSYRSNAWVIGLNLLGTSKAPTGSGIATPGFVQVNAVASHPLWQGWRLSLRANNLFNRIGLTEIPNAEAGVTANGANLARSVNGRTLSASLVHSF